MELITVTVHCSRSAQKLMMIIDRERSLQLVLGSAAAAFGFRSLDGLELRYRLSGDPITAIVDGMDLEIAEKM